MQIDAQYAPPESMRVHSSEQFSSLRGRDAHRQRQTQAAGLLSLLFLFFSWGELGAASKPQGLRRDGNASQEREREIAVNAVLIGILRRLRTIALFGLLLHSFLALLLASR